MFFGGSLELCERFGASVNRPVALPLRCHVTPPRELVSVERCSKPEAYRTIRRSSSTRYLPTEDTETETNDRTISASATCEPCLRVFFGQITPSGTPAGYDHRSTETSSGGGELLVRFHVCSHPTLKKCFTGLAIGASSNGIAAKAVSYLRYWQVRNL